MFGYCCTGSVVIARHPATTRKTWSPAGPLRRALTGIATTVVGAPTGTSTRTEAPGAGAWPAIRARTNALRVAGSIFASTATIRAVIGRGSFAANTATGSPGRSSAATACATVKSTLAAASTPCSVVSSVPSFRYCPGCTSEIPTRARNGARIVFFAMTARARLVHFLLRRGLGLPQDLEAREARCRQVGLGLLCLELRFLHGDVERDEYRAGVDDASGREHHLADRACKLVTQGDGVEREDGSDRGGRGAILPRPGDGQGHRFDGLGLARGRGIGLPGGRVFPGHQTAGSDEERSQQHGRSNPAAIVHEEATAHTG